MKNPKAKKLISFFNLVICLIFISCSSSEMQITKLNASLTKTSWLLKVLNDKQITLSEGGNEAYIILTGENKANGSGGCNNFFTSYTVTGKNIKFGLVGSTRMFCENKMETESAFFEALENTVKYRIKGNNLYLSDSVKVIAQLQAAEIKPN